MLLVVDIGNTQTTLGLYRYEGLHAHWRMTSKMERTPDECWILMKSWFESEKLRPEGIEDVMISSVVPSLTSVFDNTVRRYFKMEPVIIDTDSDHGLNIHYDDPRTVGADRICNAVAGFTKYGGPLIVVDFGTATTFDVVSEAGEYLGGSIALGVMGASDELHRVAAKLTRVDLVFPPNVVGKKTEASIQSGILWGTVSLVDGMVEHIIAEMGWKSVHVIATGGLAPMIVEKSKNIKVVEPFLTLEGMRIIHDRMRKN